MKNYIKFFDKILIDDIIKKLIEYILNIIEIYVINLYLIAYLNTLKVFVYLKLRISLIDYIFNIYQI